MNENLKKFMEILSNDTALQEELKKLGNITKEEAKKKIIEMANKKGIVLKDDDFDEKKIDKEALKKLSGGNCYIGGTNGECLCIVVGAVDMNICFIIG